MKLSRHIKGFFASLLIRLSIALRNVEDDLRTTTDLFSKVVIEHRKRHNNPVLRRMEDGVRDERFVQHFYGIVRKADEYVRSTNPDKAAKTADKFGMNVGMKD